jgi:hypothetical protein
MTVVKTADDKQPMLDALAALLERPDVDARTRKLIEDESWAIRSGIRGEREAAYEIEFHYAKRAGYAIIHDLRLEHADRVAQVDHILINRVLDVWVCETKAFSEGVKIDDHGEWYRYGGRHAHGMASPVKQNARHVEVLRDVFASGLIRLPRRLGIEIKPRFHPVVLVSSGARIDRPRTKAGRAAVQGLDTVIKVEQLVDTIERSFDERNTVALLAKVISADQVAEVAQQLAALHKPLDFDWVARFGLAPSGAGRASPEPEPAAPHGHAVAAGSPCQSCNKPITEREAEFLRGSGERFAGAILCYRCQRSRGRRSA